MEIKEHEYIRQTLERYTNCRLEDFCSHVLITNFKKYIHAFRDRTGAELYEGNFRIVNAKDMDITMIDFGIGSPQAALIINCLAYLDSLKSVIMLGMCGGIDDILEIGDFLEHKKEIYRNLELRSVLGGVLIQEYDNKPIIKEWNVVSKKKVTEREREALIFAYKVSKWAKSNSACFAQENKDGFFTIGIGAGQQSRVHVVKLAAQKAIEFGHEEELKDSVMGTDSFMPFPDALEAAVKVGTKAIIHPGGSINDESVISRADELGCVLVFCGKRVFRH